ncbi:MAG TPA: putative toxin-antitoxin system toxin component, PIN family [Stellaceae bacterium]
MSSTPRPLSAQPSRGQHSRTCIAARRGSRCLRAFPGGRCRNRRHSERAKFAAAIRPARRERFLKILRDGAIWFEPDMRVTDCRDPKDDKYLELAFAAGAEIIVSSDNDLLVLNPWRGVSILRPGDYLALA